MSTHHLLPTPENLRGRFNREFSPILRVQSGDRVLARTLDAGWGEFAQPDPYAEFVTVPVKDFADGHAMLGPIFVEGLEPGDTLEIRIHDIVPGNWGWIRAGGWPAEYNEALGLIEGGHISWRWKIADGVATADDGVQFPTRPFLGVMGLSPNLDGDQPTPPPRDCGGNIDCRELVAGSTLFLPCEVPGGLLMLGDGHAMQGDGEVAGPALECPMERVDVELIVRKDFPIRRPRAITPVGWVTLGFHQDLNLAVFEALDEMLCWLGEQGVERKRAYAFLSLRGSVRVTQIVNGIKGAHVIVDPAEIPR